MLHCCFNKVVQSRVIEYGLKAQAGWLHRVYETRFHDISHRLLQPYQWELSLDIVVVPKAHDGKPRLIWWKCFRDDRLEWLVSETKHLPIYVYLQSAAYRWGWLISRIMFSKYKLGCSPISRVASCQELMVHYHQQYQATMLSSGLVTGYAQPRSTSLLSTTPPCHQLA